MKRRLKYVVLLCIAMCCSLLAAGCKAEGNDEQIRKDGFNHVVAYDCQGGKMGNYEIRYNYYKENSYLIQPGLLPNKLPAPIRYGFDLLGWSPFRTTVKEAVMGEDGNEKVVEPAEYEYGQQWDFSGMRFDSNSDSIRDCVVYSDADEIPTYTLTLYAVWQEKCSYTVLGADEPLTVYVTEGAKIEEPLVTPVKKGFTLLGYFSDPDFETPFDFASATHPGIVDPETGSRNLKIYTKWTEGDYVGVRTSAEFKKALKAGDNMILLADIAFADGEIFSYAAKYSGVLIGNNRKITNAVINIKQERVAGATEYCYGMIGTLKDATVSGLIVEGLTLNLEVGISADTYVGLFAGKIEGGTKIENCSFSGAVNVTRKSSVSASDIVFGKLAGKVADGVLLDGTTYENITVSGI